MGQAILYGQKQQGVDIQGIVDDYYAYAGENISAGDFVEFINGVASSTNYYSTLACFVAKTLNYITSICIDATKFIVVYSYTSSTNNIVGALKIGTISNATITFSSEYVFRAAAAVNISEISITNIDTNKYVISYMNGYYVCAIVCDISNNTVTFGTEAQIASGSSSSRINKINIEYLSNTKCLLVYSKDSNAYYYVLSISDSSISSLSSGTLSATGYTQWGGLSMCRISDTKFLIARYNYGNNNYYLYIATLSINSSNTATIRGATTYLVAEYVSSVYYASCYRLTNNKAIILVSFRPVVSGVDTCQAFICNINNNTLSFGTLSTFYTTTYGIHSAYKDAVAIDNNKVAIVYGTRTSELHEDQLQMKIATISNDDSITFSTALSIGANQSDGGSYYPSLIQIENDIVALSYKHGANYGFSGMFDCSGNTPSTTITKKTYETQVRKVTTPQFDGIAQTSGTGGSATAHNQQVEVLTIANPTE